MGFHGKDDWESIELRRKRAIKEQAIAAQQQHKGSIYRVYIANVTPIDCAHWLEYADIPGATITQGFGYWDETLEPQCTVELCGVEYTAIQAFLHYIFEDTDEQAVYLVSLGVDYAKEVYRAPFDQQHEKSL